MSIGIWQIAIVVALGVLLFGRGRISDLMGDVARGITSFKKEMNSVEDNSSRLAEGETSSSGSKTGA
ncbi:twin-arginine translocase TatA/TatE family subunit [Emcibacter nanhaiensis]|uniref:Sec-independent protein translocase protein TatA n=1 Tax=Emcibacter nanhaiensis TaxID=1505037 RepID=A0A501PIA3_9PROT|nr:twin-arginine translocase TatA/TatE family subunit [Emcibacter nanhaiensis]TPD60169.1 twin-arginine translocase TatA/TatE family subunit [Emcibacter nanhaiensis]